MMKSISLHALLCFAIFTFGCAEDEDNSTSTETTAGAPDVREGSTPINQTVSIIDWLSDSAISGVEICWSLNDGDATCDNTDSEGNVTGTVAVIAGDELHLTGSKMGYYPFRTTYVIPDMPGDGSVQWSLVADAIVNTLTTELGEDADPNKGHVTALIWDASADEDGAALSGATITMVTGTASQGPNYTNPPETIGDNGLFSEDGRTTDSGIAVFNNVDPGTVALEISVEGKTCTVVAGTANGSENQVEVAVVAGMVSYTQFSCE